MGLFGIFISALTTKDKESGDNMTSTELEIYRRFRLKGVRAQEACINARVIYAFSRREDLRLIAEPEDDRYFDIHGEPEGYLSDEGHWVSEEKHRKQICDRLDRVGCWYVCSQKRSPVCEKCGDGGEWETVASIGMCVCERPCSPFDNDYVISLMLRALKS
jgi:hypothetical protein